MIPLSLYIHLPWCVRKCPYCDFNSHALKNTDSNALAKLDATLESAYIDAVIKDFNHDLPLIAGRSLRSIFLGGGTPSLFSARSLKRLLDHIRANSMCDSNIEVTLEANPGASEHDQFFAYKEVGINRISLGIQSFDPVQLKQLGRVHDEQQAHAAIESVIAAQFDRFNLDIMHGLPQQTTAQALADLKTAAKYQPHHLSWYQLTLEPNTLFAARPPQLPEEGVLETIESQGQAFIASEMQLHQYEISAYAKTKQDQAQHNINYWQFGDYLGIGAGAHSKLTQKNDQSIRRILKFKHPQTYMKQTDFIQQNQVIAVSQLPAEFMMNALRLNAGFTVQQFEQNTLLPYSEIASQVEAFIERGLLVQSSHQNVHTTDLGRRFLNTILCEF